MAHPTANPKWSEYLEEKAKKTGTWASLTLAKPLDALEVLNNTNAETMKLEVAAAGGDTTNIVAMAAGDVKFVHNLTLAKAQGQRWQYSCRDQKR